MKLAVAVVLAVIALPAIAEDAPAYLDDRSTPEAVVSSFYNAISRREYARAYSYYQDSDGLPDFEAFASGYADTSSVRVSFGQSAQEGAAGSTYWTLPVSLDATGAGGEHAYFTGCYTLRLANPAIQSEPPFQPLHIIEGHLKRSDGAGPGFAPAKCD
jgi:hypothetical protein